MDWLGLLAVQGTLRSLLQHHSSKASILWHSAFCIVQLPGGLEGKASACNAGDPGSIPGSGRSPGDGNDNPFSILARETAWTEEPGGLWYMGS